MTLNDRLAGYNKTRSRADALFLRVAEPLVFLSVCIKSELDGPVKVNDSQRCITLIRHWLRFTRYAMSSSRWSTKSCTDSRRNTSVHSIASLI